MCSAINDHQSNKQNKLYVTLVYTYIYIDVLQLCANSETEQMTALAVLCCYQILCNNAIVTEIHCHIDNVINQFVFCCI